MRTLAVKLEKRLEHWYKGEFPKLPDEPKEASTPVATNKTVTPAQTPAPVTAKTTPAPTPVASNTDKAVNTQKTSTTEHYAIQLMTSDKESDVTHFMEKWRSDLSSPSIVERSEQSKPLFILVSGNYSSLTEAQQALDNLAPKLKENRRNRLVPVKMSGDVLASLQN